MMRGPRIVVVALVGLAALASCSSGSQQTGLIVRIDTNMVQGDVELQSFDVSVIRDGASMTFFERPYSLSSGTYRLPGTLGLIPHDPNDARTVTIIVTGHVRARPTVVQRARVSFARGRVEVLDMYLARECIGAEATGACPSDQTCGEHGVCIAVTQAMLPDYVPDGGTADAAPVDPTDVGFDHADGSSVDDSGGDLVDATFDVRDVTVVESAADGAIDASDTAPADVSIGVDTLAADTVDTAPNDTGTTVDTGCDATGCSGCGTLGAACCAGGGCTGAGLTCSTGTCVACGDANQPCCGSTCNIELICTAMSVCMPCGAPSQPCCAGSVCCRGPDCPGGGSNCVMNVCHACGGMFDPCCPGVPCDFGLSCRANRCQ